MKVSGPALALLEIESIARGIVVADALVKRAPVEFALADPVSPGKYLLLFSGGVAETEEAFKAGVDVAGSTLLDKLFLSGPEPRLLEALREKFDETWGDSFAIVETHSVASTLLAADSALKRAEVWVRRLHLARGIGGKGYFVLTGSLDMIEAALEAAAASIEPRLLVAAEVIQRPHRDIKGWGL
jgi:microcompartment protein CcmL/EutN